MKKCPYKLHVTDVYIKYATCKITRENIKVINTDEKYSRW